jgi:hypothetical protein
MARQLSILLALLIMILVCVQPILAQTEKEKLLAAGLAAYQQRDFRQAIALWDQADVRQQHMYYNIARAYEQLGEWGDARVNDMCAKIIADSFYRWNENPELESALERGWARQDLETLHPLIWLKRTLREMTHPIGWGIVGALLWIGLWITVIVTIRRRVGRWIAVGFAVGLLVWVGVIATNEVLDRVLVEAVSFEATPVYSGPGSDYVLLTTWAEGYDLSIVATKDDWVQIWRADGLSGWVEQRLIWEVQDIDSSISGFLDKCNL